MEIRRELALWSHRLLGIAQTGLAFATSPYDVERYRDLLLLAAEMAAASNARAYLDEQLADQWLTEGYLGHNWLWWNAGSMRCDRSQMYRRIGLSYLKRAKHLSEILPAAWLEELEQTYPYPCAARLDQGAVVQALIETFRFQDYHLQALSEQAGGGFEPLWFWRLHEQMSQKLKAFI